MDSANLKSNPFANLFENLDEIQDFVSVSKESKNEAPNALKTDLDLDSKLTINILFEKIFQITLRSSCSNETPSCGSIYLGEEEESDDFLCKENIDDVIVDLF